MVETVAKITCEKGCAQTKNPETRSIFLRVALPADTNGNGKESHSIKESIERCLAPTKLPAACETCKGTKSEKTTITQLPEMLLVHLNRQNLDGTRRYDLIDFDDLVIDKGLTNAKADVEYELTSVTLHQRDPEKEVEEEGGHYTILVKGPEGSWAHVSDAKRTQTSHEEFKTSKLNRENGYIFAYRRLPYRASSAGADDSEDESTTLSPSSVSNKDPASQAVTIAQPPTGSAANDTMLTYITQLFNHHAAQNQREWEAQGAKRKQEWTEWADERDKNKKKKETSQTDDSDVTYDVEKHRGIIRVTMTDTQGGTTVDMQMVGQLNNNLKQTKKTKATTKKTITKKTSTRKPKAKK